MGNDHSRPADDGQEDRPPDYYELLQVSEDATDTEIKQSYRRLALINHPDKNPHRIEEATKLFADLQQAYEILSDHNERAFYDSHRNTKITTTDEELYNHVRSGYTADQSSKLSKRPRGDPGVRLEQLMRFFDPKLARRVDDTKDGFFSIYRSLFALLASDEALHTDPPHRPVLYPGFGDSTTAYAPPPGMSRTERESQSWARDFYTTWSEFSTEKSFEWVAKWDVARGDDRSMRRLMEKENKKIRDDYRKEYIDTIKQLVRFVQHRDPRFKEYQTKLAARKSAKGSKAKSTQTPSKSAPSVPISDTLDEFEEQDWQRLRLDLSDEELDVESNTPTNGAVQQEFGEAVECVACGKTFMSEASWANHERSKKHKQAMWRLKREMQAEDDVLGLDEAQTEDSAPEFGSDGDLSAPAFEESAEQAKTSEPLQQAQPEVIHPRESEGVGSSHDASSKYASQAGTSTPSVQPSKREKRRARDERKKTQTKEHGRPADVNSQPLPHSNNNARREKAGKMPSTKTVLDAVSVAEIMSDIDRKRSKLRERWGADWENTVQHLKNLLQTHGDNPPRILCLGLGRAATDRTAQIQLCLLLELSDLLQPNRDVLAFDPVWDENDIAVLSAAGVIVGTENLRGKHILDQDRGHLLFLPHCARPLYENILTENFGSDQLRRVVILGNILSDYILITPNGDPEQTGKKKRRERRPRDPPDNVLQRVVPNMSSIELSSLPDIALPGFARAFISLAFQWLPLEAHSQVDFTTPLPLVVWKDDGELL